MKEKAIILKMMPVREFDSILTCYTQSSGKQRYIAKSVMRPNSRQRGHLDVFNGIDFTVVEGKNYPIIASAQAYNSFISMRQSLPALSLAYFFGECFDKLVFENEPDEELWEFISGALEETNQMAKLEACENRSWKLFMSNKYKEMLSIMGYHEATDIRELHNSTFSSLVFCNQLIN